MKKIYLNGGLDPDRSRQAFRRDTPRRLTWLVVLPGVLLLGSSPPGRAGEPSVRLQADPTQLVRELSALEAQIQHDARPVSQAQAVAAGIRANPQLQQAYAAIQQYEWQLIAAQRQWYPSLQLSNGTPFAGVQWQSFSQNYSSASPTAPPTYSNHSQLSVFQPGISVNWNVIDPTRQPSINAAAESLRQQKLLFEVSARNLILNVQQSYYRIQNSRQLIDSFRGIYELNKKQLAMVEAQRSIGMTTVLDVEATRSQMFAQLNQLVGYSRDYIQQTADLAAAMALPEGKLAIPSDQAALHGSWDRSLDQTIQQARRQREEILASLAAAEAARWSGVAALRSYLPVFALVANGSLVTNRGPLSTQTAGVSANVNNSLSNSTAAIGMGFNWTIFDGGIQAAEAQAAQAKVRQQDALAASTELEVIRQVRSSYGQLRTAQVAFSSAQQAWRSARLAQQASQARFAVGVGDITSLVQTNEQLSQAAVQLSAAVLSYNTALAELYRYSATWPALAEREVQQRLQQLRRTPAATVIR